jgi:superfamily II DNA or RNA helicase
VPLFKRSASHFQPGDRQRGSDYFLEGRVSLEVEGARARSGVAGSEKPVYRVGVDWSRVATERVLHTYCDCQRFAEGTPCKHLWATLLALAETGPENQPPGKDRLSLRKDRAAVWRDLGVTPEDESREARQPVVEFARPSRRNNRQRRGRDRMLPLGEPGRGPIPPWRAHLLALRDEVAAASRAGGPAAAPVARPPAGVRLMINTVASGAGGALVLDVFAPGGGVPQAGGAGNGQPAGKLKPASLDVAELEQLFAAAGAPPGAAQAAAANGETAGDPPIPAVVAALPPEPPGRQTRARGRRGATKPLAPRLQRLRVPEPAYETLLPRLCAHRLLSWWDTRAPGERPALAWDPRAPYRLALHLELAGGAARLIGTLEREGEPGVPATTPLMILPRRDGAPDAPGLLLFEDHLSRVVLGRHELPWLDLLREIGEIAIPREDLEEALAALHAMPSLPRLDMPEALRLAEARPKPRPRLLLKPDPSPAWTNPPLQAELSFAYGELDVHAGDPRPAVIDLQGQRMIWRDGDAEHAALVRLLELGLKPVETPKGHGLELPPRDLPLVAEPLLMEGWDVEVHGTTLRPPSPPALRIQSGIDWFEVSGGVDFAGDQVGMKEVLAAVSRGERFVKLPDGSQGLLPASWMETYDNLARLAQDSTEEGLRFLHSQALLVDALLVAMPPQQVDKAFAELRDRLRGFERITAKKESRGFGGTLRSYQRDGLGWLDFLREYGLGGVLADDMGLGKTVQLLALLHAQRPTGAARKAAKDTLRPWLVVAPRSLIYNWIDEAARFTPKLKVIEYGGPDREELRPELASYDLVVTTYGTLRRDVAFLATVEFDTVVLDEAQAIKNRDSQAAKASRLLHARHRLALTGTPIENHLGELGSIFEFLNPGLLGQLPWLDVLQSGRQASREELATIATGIRPFILRRTKQQVLEDLPAKTEQDLLCTLHPRQRELYDQLKAAYQASLLKQVEKKGIGASAIQVLEALLRLRQVACHPGLVDPTWEEAGSCKLDALFDQVNEVLEEGHKLLVFSQFTKLLGYVRKHFDDKGVPYAYLDGSTRDRGEVVERFQTDPKCNLFLISLKAGGVGLNLTAAGYVFLLDPWWNPAVEAQAIDRAHRIGQTQPVFAYRLIARDTVEEKIIELQRSKRQLADAILAGEGTPLGDLTADDLRMLLS